MHRLEGYAGRAFAQHEHFGGDAQGDFVGRLGSEVKADGRVDLGELFTCDAIFEQVTEYLFDFAGAADHAYIAGMGFQSGSQGVLVKMMPARDDDYPAGLVRLEFAYSLRDIAKGQLYLLAKDLWVRQVTAIIYDDDTKIKGCCQTSQRLGDVARASNNEARLWIEDFNEQFEGRAAATDGLVSIQVDVNKVGVALAKRLHGFLRGLGIDLCAGETSTGGA